MSFISPCKYSRKRTEFFLNYIPYRLTIPHPQGTWHRSAYQSPFWALGSLSITNTCYRFHTSASHLFYPKPLQLCSLYSPYLWLFSLLLQNPGHVQSTFSLALDSSRCLRLFSLISTYKPSYNEQSVMLVLSFTVPPRIRMPLRNMTKTL